MGSSIDRATLAAFAGVVLFGGMNAVAIKFSYQELPPFWGAALRFGLAALVLFALVAVRRVPLPRGRALVGSLLYGLFVGISFALAYWGLLETPAGLAMLLLATVPLLTLLLAVIHGLERFSAQSAVGALVALGGIAVVAGERAFGASAAALPFMFAILLGAAAIAQGTVLVKRLPRSHPLANNAVAMAIGATLLMAVSVIAGEPLVVPAQLSTLAAVGYLVLFGSVLLFMLYLYVIERWSATSTSYTLLPMPVVAALAAAALLGEPITVALLAGGALVIAGVYLGAFAPSLRRPFPGLLGRRAAPATELQAAGRAPGMAPSLEGPGCP